MTFQVRGLRWLSARTDHPDALADFYRQALGLQPVVNDPGYALFRLENGDMVEVIAADEESRRLFTTGPIPGFEVDDVDAARADLERLGIPFIGSVHTAADGGRWTFFTAPDGNIYELTQPGRP